jgi:2-polyprenyl-3-methyl-5-hydroxy-6-metoxy-1,4-benzoquinol methylase
MNDENIAPSIFEEEYERIAYSAIVVLTLLGDRLGLWKAMARAGPMTPTQIACKVDCSERYIQEWLYAEASAGHIAFDSTSGTFHLLDEYAAVFADDDSSLSLTGPVRLLAEFYRDLPRIESAFRTGDGIPWHEHDDQLYAAVDAALRPSYLEHLCSEWIPALEGCEPKLQAGANVADVGTGHGSAVLLMAQAYPRSRFTGFDSHGPSVARANEAAREAGVADRVTFSAVPVTPSALGQGYDLITCFDSFHDLGDPLSMARSIRKGLSAQGTWMLVEPLAHTPVPQVGDAVTQMYLAASTFLCIPTALAQGGGAALGAQAGGEPLRSMAIAAGFSKFRKVAQTRFNSVYEASI